MLEFCLLFQSVAVDARRDLCIFLQRSYLVLVVILGELADMHRPKSTETVRWGTLQQVTV